jgi:uncharacterized protein (DUF362 family)
MSSSVSILECDTYEQEVLDEKVRTICKSASMPDVRGKSVLLKPNILSDAREEKCITTNSHVVRAMIHLLKEQGAKKICVGDSPGLQGPSFSPKNCRIAEVCESEGVDWVDFTKSPKTRPIPYTHHRKLALASVIDQVDLVFSLPKFKTHQLMYATGATKNLFGLVPGLHKSPCHVKYPSRESFASLIVGIMAAVKPAFALMDGVLGMEGAGPANGVPRKVGYLLASTDLVALDYCQATIMGYDPLTIPIVREGIRRNLTSCPPAYTDLRAEDLVIEDFLRLEQQKRTRFIGKLVAPFVSSRIREKQAGRDRMPPTFLSEPCIQCQRCVKICPAGALKLVGKQIEIDTSLCVRCYCCHEVCPADAIRIDGPGRTAGKND